MLVKSELLELLVLFEPPWLQLDEEDDDDDEEDDDDDEDD